MEYIVHYTIVCPSGDESEMKMVRHIVFSDDTAFEFHGMHGSLRYSIVIPGAYEKLLIEPRTDLYYINTNLQQQQKAYAMFGGGFIKKSYNIVSCGVLNDEKGKSFAKRVIEHDTPYADSDTRTNMMSYKQYV